MYFLGAVAGELLPSEDDHRCRGGVRPADHEVDGFGTSAGKPIGGSRRRHLRCDGSDENVTQVWRKRDDDVCNKTDAASRPCRRQRKAANKKWPWINQKRNINAASTEAVMIVKKRFLQNVCLKYRIIVFLKCKTHCKWFISRFIFLISHPRLEPPVILAKLETQPWVGDIFKSRWLAAVLNIQYLRLTDLSRRWGNSVFSQSRQQQTVAAMWWRRHFHDARLVNSTQSHLTGKSN